ncbi:MAG: hypothetical protein ACOC4C_00590 [Fibrobacterota bacterium]
MAKNVSFTRKHFFIDRKLQGRYMLTFLIPMVIMLMFMLFTLYFASQTIITTTTSTIAKDLQAMMSSRFQDTMDPTVEQYQGLVRDMRVYLNDFSDNAVFKRTLIGALLWVFGIGISLVIIQIVFLTIFFSHKLAGPVYRFERVCHQIIDGNYNQKITLRKGDEMQKLAALFNEAISLTRQRFEKIRSVSEKKDADLMIDRLLKEK